MTHSTAGASGVPLDCGLGIGRRILPSITHAKFESQLLVGICLLVIAAQVSAQESESTQPASNAESATVPAQLSSDDVFSDGNWAQQYLAEDPLAARETITLQDIREGLASEDRRDQVITQHFQRVSQATREEKIAFLTEAMQSEYTSVQRQAAVELQAINELEAVVRQILLEYLTGEDAKLRSAAIVGLEQIEIPAEKQSDAYWRVMIEGLSDEDERVVQSAMRRLKTEGPNAVPTLLAALKDGHPNLVLVAQVLSEIVGSKISEGSVTRSREGERLPFEAEEKTTVGKAGKAPPPEHTAREVDLSQPELVTVYFGTNRELIDRPPPTWMQILPYPLLAILLVVATIPFLRSGHQAEEGKRRHGCLRWGLPLLMLLGAVWSSVMFRDELQRHWRLGTGPSFGPRRDVSEVVHYGTCDVTIPPSHQVGAVERPVIGPEDEQEHVVLKFTEKLEEQNFFELVRAKIADFPVSDQACFVFIHGFNVDFETAARRTAQIHYDLKFAGVPMFFSWPSRANVRHYFSDRNEIEFSRYVIKQFLLDVAEKTDADRIHVIAHSMGADATCRAIAELGDKGKIFDQIVLAAPDIDREVFRLQLAPKLTRTANRTTLYCSKNDLALMLSRNFNDSARAGDSSQGALVLQDVDTVDASEIDTDLLGHSYYGDCLPLLHDVNKLLRASLSPLERELQPWPVDDQLLYWTLPEASEGEDPSVKDE
jgi:esterase/lipase superfamily enzyme